MTPSLIVFCKSPGRKGVKTRLAAAMGNRFAQQFYEHCLYCLREDLTQVAGEFDVNIYAELADDVTYCREFFNWPVFQQRSGDLFAKMKEAHARHGACTIMIGSDAPTLPLERWRQAKQTLLKDSVVLGPCRDGGFYLLGVRGSFPDLSQVPWSSDKTLERTQMAIRKKVIEPGLLEPWYDIDRVEDIAKLWLDLNASDELTATRKNLLHFLKAAEIFDE